ncbi:MAG: hypothetical protein ABJ020_13240 [Parasphingorhabdus sp.]|uniref:hypothetical protein n=1 Tax=Parasphingorhabdus sp. TaxID=2709688 RepID=UPI003265F390
MKHFYEFVFGSVNRVFLAIMSFAIIFLGMCLADLILDLGLGLSSKKTLLLATMIPLSILVYLFTKGVIRLVGDFTDFKD